MNNQFRTIIISDLHLGAKGSRSKELNNFLKQYKCDHLILNGDIIDRHYFKKKGLLNKKYIRLYNRLLKLIKDNNTKITIVLGNHDADLQGFSDYQTKNFHVVKDLIYQSGNKQYYIIHGDIHDNIEHYFPNLAKIGKVGYRLAVWLCKKFGSFFPSNHHSLSTMLKLKLQNAADYTTAYEKQLVKIANLHNCQGVICGHTHIAAMKETDGLNYFNSGDWIDSLSALVEDNEGEWSLIYYNETPILQRTTDMPAEKSNDIVNLKQYNKASYQ